MASTSPHPSQTQLLLPVLQTLDQNGGRAKTTDLYEAVAERTGIPVEARAASTTLASAGRINTFARSVRWAQQRGKLLGLMRPVEPGIWEITDTGRRRLRTSRPGLVITIFVTERGAALWAAAEDAIGYLDDGSVQLILTSPPYPLIRQKEYGNRTPQEYVDWFLRLAQHWPQKLTPDGSIVLNLGDVWEAGRPTVSIYQERLLCRLIDELGLRLAQRFAWLNPSKLPAPAEWVTVDACARRTTWSSSTGSPLPMNPYADNRQVLVPYSPSMQARLADGGERHATRPSGHTLAAGAFGTDNGGAIPGNCLILPNTSSNDRYLEGCRQAHLPIHPARFPTGLPEFFVKFLTRPGDLVFDPFGGSATTGEVAERLDRRWVTSDQVLAYVLGARHRFSRHQLAANPSGS